MAKREFGFYTSQTAKTFSSFTVISFVDRIEGCFPFQSRLRRSFARHTPPHWSIYQENSRRSEENQKVSFLKYLTPPDFCLFDVRRRVEKNVSHWLKNGGVLRGSGRGGKKKAVWRAALRGRGVPTGDDSLCKGRKYPQNVHPKRRRSGAEGGRRPTLYIK